MKELTFDKIVELYFKIAPQYRDTAVWKCRHGVNFGECDEEICRLVLEQIRALDNRPGI